MRENCIEVMLSEHAYRGEQLRSVRRSAAVRKAIRLRALLHARRAERQAGETLVRAA